MSRESVDNNAASGSWSVALPLIASNEYSIFFSDDPRLPPIPTRLALAKLLMEVELFAQALLVLNNVMASDDQDVEAWYLEGWCFFLMAENAKENGNNFDGMSWEELATDARDCLETCQVVSVLFFIVAALVKLTIVSL